MKRGVITAWGAAAVLWLTPLLVSAEVISECTPSFEVSYTTEHIAASFTLDLSRCTEAGELGGVNVISSIERSSIAAEDTKQEAQVQCEASDVCFLSVLLPHPSLELADYVARFSYQSEGPHIIAEASSFAMTCASVLLTTTGC
jgi:hypothetical protein